MKFPKNFNLVKLDKSIGLFGGGSQTHYLSIDIRVQGKPLGKTFTIKEKYNEPKLLNIRKVWISITWVLKGRVYCFRVPIGDSQEKIKKPYRIDYDWDAFLKK